MQRTNQGVRIQGRLLPQQPLLSNMSRSENTFALLVEEMLNTIKQPEYRQIVVEVYTYLENMYLFFALIYSNN
jgi:phosphorylase kinase alpha/beta subunit